MSLRFFKCLHCGQIIAMVTDKDVPVMCCGEKMFELKPGSVDAALEKHVPVIAADGDKVTVTVGSVEHPMLEEHYIEWIYIETDAGIQAKALKPGDKPEAVFTLGGDKLVAAYAYCNLHGLWMAEA